MTRATRIHRLTCPTLDALHTRAVADCAHVLAWSLSSGAEVLQVERRVWVWREGAVAWEGEMKGRETTRAAVERVMGEREEGGR